ncbi:MAG TPA: type II toxin-antitoxin system RelE/ParE family toxin [Candidatus Eremiobacteraeota bacterium]|nr:type II toxin-antitoxin system RelE/ParE family toxin [Candidatus Eremiobacteraeota bacterium]
MPVIILKSALKDIEKLDEKTRERVLKALDKLKKGKIRPGKLQGYDKCYKVKVGKWRVIFEIDLKGNIVVTRVRLRKEVYRNM